MASANQMPPQIEELVDSRVHIEKSRRLLTGFESAHTALSNSSRLM